MDRQDKAIRELAEVLPGAIETGTRFHVVESDWSDSFRWQTIRVIDPSDSSVGVIEIQVRKQR